MRHSDTLGELAKALAAAQSKMDFAKKDKKNPFFKSSYADLAAVWEVCRMVLPGNGLAVIQTMDAVEGDNVSVETTLAHESGEWVSSVCTLPCVKRDPQAYGSAITYARRYSLAAIVGVIADDDDGNAAAGKGRERQAQAFEQAVKKIQACTTSEELVNLWNNSPQWKNLPLFAEISAMVKERGTALKAKEQQSQQPEPLTPAQLKAIQAHYSRRGHSRDQRLNDISKFVGRTIGSMKDLTKDEATELIDALNSQEATA